MSGQVRKNRGRPSVSKVLVDRLVAAHEPTKAAPNVFKGYGQKVDLIEEAGLEAKLTRISEIIASRLEKVAESGSKLHDSESAPGGALSGHRPWSSDDCPENVLFWAEAEFFANDRIVAGLTSHLVEHLAIGEELRRIALSARRRAQDELETLPGYMTKFANLLTACGVTKGDLHHMSKQRLNAVIAAIRGMDASTPGLVPDRLPMETAMGPGHEGGEVVFERSEHGVSDVLDAGSSADSEGVSTGLGDVVVEDSEVVRKTPAETAAQTLDGEVDAARSDDGNSSGSVRPKGRWDDLDLERLGYRIEVATASTDADMAALQMKMPDVDRLIQMAMPRSPEVVMAEGVVEQRDRVLLDRFFERVSRRTNVRLKEPERRLLGMLLVDLPEGGGPAMLCAGGWCDGLVLPGEPGTTKVRRVVAIDRSEEGLRDAYRR